MEKDKTDRTGSTSKGRREIRFKGKDYSLINWKLKALFKMNHYV